MKFIPVFIVLTSISLFSMNSSSAQAKIKLAYIGDTSHSAYSGIEQGLDEARLQGQFLGYDYELDTFHSDEIINKNLSEYIAILVALNGLELLTLSGKITHPGLFNITAEDNFLREACIGNVLHIIPSEKMKSDAVKQWRSKNPGSSPTALAWHPAFVKFAARDLNKRYKKAFGKPMDDYAWAGWAATKIISDTVVREAITNPVVLQNFIRTNLSFDGQKGLEMNFRETGQLRQILLISQNGKLAGEAPVRGVVKVDDVDSLGITECSK